MSFNYIDLFAGCGGLSFGLHQAGWNGIFAIEKNKDAFSTLHRNLISKENLFEWPEWLEVSNHDINELISFNESQLKKMSGRVSLVAGGPPCQGFSMAGKRDSDDYRNQLSDAYLKFIKLVKPKIVFFENVHGFTIGFNKNGSKEIPFSAKVINSLEKMDYKVSGKLIDVSMYGVPQKRKRYILVGSLESDPALFFDFLERNVKSFLKARGLTGTTTVEQAIDDLKRVHGEIESLDSKGFFSGEYGTINSNYQKYMRKFTELKVPNSHRFANHRLDTVRLFRELMTVSDEPKRISPKQNLVKGLKKRGITPLKSGFQCNTVTSIPDDYVHYSEPRILTVREMARIQSFPDSFEFMGKYTTGGELRKVDVPRYTQVANAVPPLFAEQVGLALKELLRNG